MARRPQVFLLWQWWPLRCFHGTLLLCCWHIVLGYYHQHVSLGPLPCKSRALFEVVSPHSCLSILAASRCNPTSGIQQRCQSDSRIIKRQRQSAAATSLFAAPEKTLASKPSSSSSSSSAPPRRRRLSTSSSSSTAAARATPSDEALLNSILSELGIQPPWTSTPEGSVRTFNYVLSSMLVRYNTTNSRDGNAAFAPSSGSATKTGPLGPRAEQVMRYMLQECRDRRELAPNAVTLNAVLAAYSKSIGRGGRQGKKFANADRTSAQTTIKLLQEWQHLFQAGVVAEDVDLVSYNTVMSACAKAGLPDQAEDLFGKLQARYERTKDQRFRPDIISYNCVLNALAIAGKTDKVGDLFRIMRTDGPAPTIHSYHDVLYAYSKSNHPEHAETFLSWWLLESEQRYLHNVDDEIGTASDSIRPLIHSYNIVLHALSQVKQRSGTADAIRRARKLFHSMPSRDAISYTTMISAICRQLGQSPNVGALATSTSIASSVNRGVNSRSSIERSTARSAASSRAAAAVGTSALDAVRDILQQAWQDHSSKMISMDSAFCANVLYSLATLDDKNMPTFAESFVQDCVEKGITLDIHVYNSLIHCWAKANSRESGDRVLDVLNQLEQESAMPRPDARTYTNVLDALKTSRAYGGNGGSEIVLAAEDIVTRMESVGPAPTVATYTALILIYARSRLANKAALAASVLERMKQYHINGSNREKIVPNLISYNAVLNACEHTMVSSDRAIMEDCLKVACSTFDELRNMAAASPTTIKANHVTYASFLGTLATFMPPDTTSSSRQELVALVFRRCCVEGQASALVLRKLRNAAVTEERYRILLEGRDEDNLPASWTCHVKDTLARQQ